MKTGFSFNGKHTNDFGVIAKTTDRPVEPPAKEELYDSSDMDGSHDFNGAQRRRYYSDRIIKVELAVQADDLRDLQKRLSRVATWLRGSGELIFDDTPNVKWNARIVDSISYAPEHGGRSTVLTISFKAKPFSELTFDIPDGPSLDDNIELDSDIPLDFGEYFTFEGAGTYTIKNIGDAYTKPTIEVSGSTGSISIECGGKKLTVNASGDYVIDCEIQQVYTETDGSKTNLMSQVEGLFFEFVPGDNEVKITGDATYEIGYTPKYMYDADMSDIGLEN